ncbi:hypothetical protein L3X38_012677 [Prunus dulcis]|uniref:Uncharacterized protein n=1 Tax=Prunus dulcis TaxID=3755 RepID=A0AAD4ZG98_PRUDU|nr:hypothetical protein L3X38_012677 [Prunus dulcis]
MAWSSWRGSKMERPNNWNTLERGTVSTVDSNLVHRGRSKNMEKAKKVTAARRPRVVGAGPGDKDLGSRASMVLSQVGPTLRWFCYCGSASESAPRLGHNSFIGFFWAMGPSVR